VVHNGIVENYASLREELVARGHTFTSETDTEVIPHLVESYRHEGLSPEEAFRAAIDRLEGRFAVVMIVADRADVFAARNGSPLVLGVGDDRRFLASDVPSFLEHTDRVVYLEDGDVVRLSPDQHVITDLSGRPVERPVQTVDWQPEDAQRDGFDHYMLKEIHEQPADASRGPSGPHHRRRRHRPRGVPPGSFADVGRSTSSPVGPLTTQRCTPSSCWPNGASRRRCSAPASTPPRQPPSPTTRWWSQ